MALSLYVASSLRCWYTRAARADIYLKPAHIVSSEHLRLVLFDKQGWVPAKDLPNSTAKLCFCNLGQCERSS